VTRTPRIIVIGGGIGGMTAAAALHQQGIAFDVYERASSLGEVGAGLQILPNAVKVLKALGLERELLRDACPLKNWTSLHWDTGALRFREPLLAGHADYGAPYLTGHRADMHAMLMSKVPSARIHLSAVCTSVETRGNTAVARFADGREVEGDAVIGADGIKSVVRETLFGADQPRFTGQMAWRAMVPIDKVPTRVGPDKSVVIDPLDYSGWIGPGGHVVCYPIRRGEIYNIFAGQVSEAWVEESWSVSVTREEMIAAFAGWNEAIISMLGNVDGCFKWGIYDRDPLTTWTKGRVTLLGDAGHPMMPTLAAGAGISIEDGYALARNLAAHRDDVVAGLAAYDAERVPRASRVQLQARQQFANNKKKPAPPPLDRSWIFAHDATKAPVEA
jgi:salicylate hydroxylase